VAFAASMMIFTCRRGRATQQAGREDGHRDLDLQEAVNILRIVLADDESVRIGRAVEM